MKCVSLFQSAVMVICLFTASNVTGAGYGYTNNSSYHPFFLLLFVLLLFTISNSTAKNNKETDSAFYNRVICTAGTSPNCLSCFKLSTRPACAANTTCSWEARNNFCIPV
ncbi:hypothetical protein ACJMK2_022340 [Sinanodonta woodiana]|uniref:Uncharacterized protein n=1 Tax=Sinanodonta woodiana TaxID=1069815 RepID=A0ABD3TIQ8_SINWO